MQDATGFWVYALGEALLLSPLGASELVVGLLVATTFVAFAAKSLVPQRPATRDLDWSQREPSHR